MKKRFRELSIYVLIFVIIAVTAWAYQGKQAEDIKKVDFSVFVTEVINGNVTTINNVDTTINGELKSGTKFVTYAPTAIEWNAVYAKYVFPQIESGNIKQVGEPPKQPSILMTMLPTLLMIVIMVIFFFMMMGQAGGGGGGGKVMSFGRSRAKLHKEEDLKKITFKDVAGLEEEKEELFEVVDFLKSPMKYNQLGARIPKGILLVGPPGTGKTYISKAAAGEAGVPFYSISGSDFVEMFVGVGASRVRDLFEQAKKTAPCIVFIDEIDAVGRKRGAGLGGGHDEREQTLNQLLVEMDGFADNAGIIILAATNRPDILDPALLRPGRFDRQVVIGTPDAKGREAIFKVHSRNKPLADDVDAKVLAKRTPGFTPADIENMLNEAALLTARKNRVKIEMDAVEEAINKVMMGPEKKSRVVIEKERKLTAYHEAGHALIAYLQPDADPVHQVTITPRGRAGGFTMMLPKEDKDYVSKSELEKNLLMLLGGRVAEQLILGDISTGAGSDLERATRMVKNMITRYGMNEKFGPINYGDGDEVFLGKDFSSKSNYSEQLAGEIDDEIRRKLKMAYDDAEKLLSENVDKLHAIASLLLERENLDADQFLAVVEGREIPERSWGFKDEEKEATFKASLEEAKAIEGTTEGAEEKALEDGPGPLH